MLKRQIIVNDIDADDDYLLTFSNTQSLKSISACILRTNE